MNWTTIQNALKAWATAGSGLAAIWENEPRLWVGQERVVLAMRSFRAIGVDEQRYQYDSGADPGEEMQPIIAGVRSFVLQVRVESRNQSPTKHAAYFLELLQTSLAKPSQKAALNAAGCPYARTLTSGTVADIESDGRMVSVGVMDLEFNAATNVTDTSEVTGYIDTVEVSSVAPGDVEGFDDEAFGNV